MGGGCAGLESQAYYPVAESELERKEKLKVLRLEHVREHS